MPTPPWDDTAAFFALGDFAIVVKAIPQDGELREFPGIYDDPYLNAQLGEYEADTSRPRVTCMAADVVGLVRGDVVIVDGRAFDMVSDPQGDGTGTALLELAPQEGEL